MRFAQDHTVEICLLNGEVDAFRRIVELAICRLQSSPMRQMKGSPHHVQDGVKGTDLLAVKSLVSKLAGELGLGEPALEPAKAQENVASQATDSESHAENGTAATKRADGEGIPREVQAILEAIGDLPIVGVTVMKLERKS